MPVPLPPVFAALLGCCASFSSPRIGITCPCSATGLTSRLGSCGVSARGLLVGSEHAASVSEIAVTAAAVLRNPRMKRDIDDSPIEVAAHADRRTQSCTPHHRGGRAVGL